MVKKVLGVIGVVAVCAVAGWNYQQSKQSVKLSDLALENVEALAEFEFDPPIHGGEGENHRDWQFNQVLDKFVCFGSGYKC